jgi:hypothetical protein
LRTRLERLSRRLLGDAVRGQPAQVLVDQRQELGGGVRVAGLQGFPPWAIPNGLSFEQEATLVGLIGATGSDLAKFLPAVVLVQQFN